MARPNIVESPTFEKRKNMNIYTFKYKFSKQAFEEKDIVFLNTVITTGILT